MDERRTGLYILAFLHAPLVVISGALFFPAVVSLAAWGLLLLPLFLGYLLLVASLVFPCPATWRIAVVIEVLLLAGWGSLAISSMLHSERIVLWLFGLLLMLAGLALLTLMILLRPRTRLVYGVSPAQGKR